MNTDKQSQHWAVIFKTEDGRYIALNDRSQPIHMEGIHATAAYTVGHIPSHVMGDIKLRCIVHNGQIHNLNNL